MLPPFRRSLGVLICRRPERGEKVGGGLLTVFRSPQGVKDQILKVLELAPLGA